MLTKEPIVYRPEARVTVTVDTVVKGEIEVEEDRIVTFVEPLLGFEHLKRFLVFQTQEGPIFWLQSVEEREAAFCIVTPFAIGLDPDYEIGTQDVEDLEVNGVEDITVYTMVTLAADANDTTTNLRAPILVAKSGKAK